MKQEIKILKMSALGALAFAVVGIAWGIISQSKMIIFDGMYSFVSLILSLVALYISNYMSKKEVDKFPFGKHMLEPIVIAFKSLVIAYMCLSSLVGALQQIAAGGNEIEYGFALVYATISVVGCGAIYVIIKKMGKKISSELLDVESTQWLMDALLSLGVLIGFIIAAILSRTSLNYLNRYIDPAMVVITSLLFIRVPVKTFINSFGEIISVKADDSINDGIYTLVKNMEEEYNFEESITRVSKTGGALRIEIDFVYNEDTDINDLDDMDRLREELQEELKDINYKKWLSVTFTGDRKWAI